LSYFRPAGNSELGAWAAKAMILVGAGAACGVLPKVGPDTPISKMRFLQQYLSGISYAFFIRHKIYTVTFYLVTFYTVTFIIFSIFQCLIFMQLKIYAVQSLYSSNI
jgi:hypothetical protein